MVWTGFLTDKTKLTEEQREAWMQLGKEFADTAFKHLKALGLPTVTGHD